MAKRKSPEYFQGAATAAAAVAANLTGKRRTAVIEKVHAKVRNQGIKFDDFEKLVAVASRPRK